MTPTKLQASDALTIAVRELIRSPMEAGHLILSDAAIERLKTCDKALAAYDAAKSEEKAAEDGYPLYSIRKIKELETQLAVYEEAAKPTVSYRKLLEDTLVDIANSCSIEGHPDDAAYTLQWIEKRARDALAAYEATPDEPELITIQVKGTLSRQSIETLTAGLKWVQRIRDRYEELERNLPSFLDNIPRDGISKLTSAMRRELEAKQHTPTEPAKATPDEKPGADWMLDAVGDILAWQREHPGVLNEYSLRDIISRHAPQPAAVSKMP